MDLKSGFTRPSWSWKRAVGITALRQRIARKTGIPTTQAGRERKAGRLALRAMKTLFWLVVGTGVLLLGYWLVS